MITVDEELLAPAALVEEADVEEDEAVLDALELLELLPAPTVIEKSFDAELLQLSVAVTRTITVASALGAVTVVLAVLAAESDAPPLTTVHA